MADIADTANDAMEIRLLQALENRPTFNAPSVSECENCGNDIPAERQKLGGVKYCIECKNALEKDLTHYKH